MSQTEKPTTTNPSRRSALAGLTGAAVAGVGPAIAVGFPEVDPVFEAIKAEREAHAAHSLRARSSA
jgi:hypothetical protein